MNIQHSLKGSEGKFFIKEDDKPFAEMVYKMPNANTITITHTEVDENYEGKGVGKSLVEEAVNFARKESFKITAVCPFAKDVLQKNTGYHDVYIG